MRRRKVLVLLVVVLAAIATVTATIGGQVYTDSVLWTLDAAQVADQMNT